MPCCHCLQVDRHGFYWQLTSERVTKRSRAEWVCLHGLWPAFQCVKLHPPRFQAEGVSTCVDASPYGSPRDNGRSENAPPNDAPPEDAPPDDAPPDDAPPDNAPPEADDVGGMDVPGDDTNIPVPATGTGDESAPKSMRAVIEVCCSLQQLPVVCCKIAGRPNNVT